ncbi:MAG: tetratricopeptide repeat protein [Ignavibacteria bacterium]|nr:tetratricopeptide repeat protein [Ignavibacteria bacterium]
MLKLKYIVPVICLLFVFILNSNAQDDLQKGKDAINKGDYVSAVNFLSNAVKVKQNYETYYHYGLALYMTGSLDKAEQSLKSALKDDDEGIDAMLTLGAIYSDQKKYDDANLLFKKALKIEPDNINAMIAQANNFSLQGKIDDAIKSLTLATTISKENPKVYIGLGDAYRIRGSYQAAVKYYKDAIALKKLPNAFTGLGDTYYRQKKYNEAIVEYNNAITTDPNYADAYLGKGKILYFGGQYFEAAEAFTKYSQLRPGSQEGNSYYAKTLYAQGVDYFDKNQIDQGNEKFSEALKMLSDVLKNDPKSITGNLYTAYIYTEKADNDTTNKTDFLNKAVEYFGKVSIKDYELEDLQKLAKVNTSLKNYDEADKYYTMAVSKDSLDYITYYEWGKSQYKAEKFDLAIDKFQRAIDLGMKGKLPFLFKGFCYYSMKKYTEAAPMFQMAIDADSSYQLAREFLARSYRFASKNEEAIKAYEEVLKMDPENKEAIDMIKALNAKKNN